MIMFCLYLFSKYVYNIKLNSVLKIIEDFLFFMYNLLYNLFWYYSLFFCMILFCYKDLVFCYYDLLL